MVVAQSPLEMPAPSGAVVARQLSVWPFAARTQRLFLLLDPSLSDRELRTGVGRVNP